MSASRARSGQAAVEAAKEAFLEHGYQNVSLTEIADRAGVSTATLFKRFPTKASLFEAIVTEFWRFDATDGTSLKIGDPCANLRKIGREYVSLMQRSKMVAFYRVFIAESQQFPELGRLMLERGKLPYLRRISEYLGAERRAGNLGTWDDSKAASQFMAIIADQLFWPVLLVPGFSVSDQEAIYAVEDAVLTIIARYMVEEKSPSKDGARRGRSKSNYP